MPATAAEGRPRLLSLEEAACAAGLVESAVKGLCVSDGLWDAVSPRVADWLVLCESVEVAACVCERVGDGEAPVLSVCDAVTACVPVIRVVDPDAVPVCVGDDGCVGDALDGCVGVAVIDADPVPVGVPCCDAVAA